MDESLKPWYSVKLRADDYSSFQDIKETTNPPSIEFFRELNKFLFFGNYLLYPRELIDDLVDSVSPFEIENTANLFECAEEDKEQATIKYIQDRVLHFLTAMNCKVTKEGIK